MDEFQKELNCTILVCIYSEFSSAPQNSCPQNVVCNLTGNSVFTDVISLRISKWNIFDLEWVLKPISGDLMRRGQDTGDTHTHRRKPYEAEIKVALPQAREHLGPPKVGRGKKGFFSRAFWGILTPLTPWLYTKELGKQNACCFKPHGLWSFVVTVLGDEAACDTS